jgi:pathogenesis-related protein 1
MRAVLLGLALVTASCATQSRGADETIVTVDPPTRAQARSNPRASNREPTRELAGLLDAHNRVRAQVGVGPLTWANDLARVAQRWAEHLAARGCTLQHSNSPHGENLFWTSAPVEAAAVVGSWAAEQRNYRYATNSCPGGVCGHYTQVVWARSTKLGCGMARCGSAQIWVCNYDPPGNVRGQKPY